MEPGLGKRRKERKGNSQLPHWRAAPSLWGTWELSILIKFHSYLKRSPGSEEGLLILELVGVGRGK